MSMIIAEVYEAFKDAGASEEKAQQAARAITDENIATKGDIARLEKEIAAIRSDVTLLKWMIGVVIAAVVLPLIRDLAL